MQTIHEILEEGARDHPAIGAPGRPSLTYDGLRALRVDVCAQLRGFGIEAEARVAIVLPNGPMMATVFLTIGSAASTAPLNPAYTTDEFKFYLGDLKPAAVVVAAGDATPARDAACALHIPVIEIEDISSGPAGAFRFVTSSPARGAKTNDDLPGSQSEALVLHTSGTTSRPKLVPLTQKNLESSAQNICKTLDLSNDDVGLNIMPLFHIHGLVASLLSSMRAGAHVICATAFDALKVYRWLDEARPTWYTGVPTMHQAILARAPHNADVIARQKLRFIRSSSAPLPPPVMAELEDTFCAPVIEAYGMTEAAHQMSSNPLPPQERKRGTVGLAAGPEIAIMDDEGNLIGSGQTGEVVIHGTNVFAGYDNNPAANAEAFEGKWFRTGDQGMLDEEGYLTLTGRLKEIINRGGEKIAPREVDEVLQAHPAVAQVVAFALSHDKLGEDVAAVVVLKAGVKTTSSELRAFAAKSLAPFKVPRTIVIRDEIPKGATGKLQRIGLAAKLGLAL